MSLKDSSDGHEFDNGGRATPTSLRNEGNRIGKHNSHNSNKSLNSLCSSKAQISLGDTEGCIIYANNALKRMTQAHVDDVGFEKSVVGKTLVSMFGDAGDAGDKGEALAGAR